MSTVLAVMASSRQSASREEGQKGPSCVMTRRVSVHRVNKQVHQPFRLIKETAFPTRHDSHATTTVITMVLRPQHLMTPSVRLTFSAHLSRSPLVWMHPGCSNAT